MNKKKKKQNELETFRINVSFTESDYEQFKNIAAKEHRSMSDVVRVYAKQGLNGTVGVENINLISKIIREQMKILLDPSVERICALTAKTCIMAATSAYLNTDSISRLVPDNKRIPAKDAFDAAYLKGVKYTKSKLD